MLSGVYTLGFVFACQENLGHGHTQGVGLGAESLIEKKSERKSLLMLRMQVAQERVSCL